MSSRNRKLIDKLVDLGYYKSRSSAIRNMIHSSLSEEIEQLNERAKLFKYLKKLEEGLETDNPIYLDTMKKERKKEIERVGSGRKGRKEKIRVPKEIAEEILSLNR